MTRLLALLLCATAAGGPLRAQSLLDRPPNISGGWVAPAGTIQFNFLHRFVSSGEPERKITNFPTFLVGTGLFHRAMLGFNYATNSTLAPRYPNEWEFFGRWLALSQDAGAAVDLSGQLGYNLAAEGLDGEISVARGLGKVRLIGVTRLLDDPTESGHVDVAVGGGPRKARIDVDQARALLFRFHRPAEGHGVGLRRVRAHEQDAVAVGHILLVVGGCAAAERGAQTGHRGAVSYPRLVLDRDHPQPATE